MTTSQLSLGGLAAAGAILILTGFAWWRSRFALPTVLGFGSGLLNGILSALCSGGLMGFAAHHLAAVTNRAGDLAVGPKAAQLLKHAAPAGLAPGGGVITMLLLLLAAALWRCADHQLRRHMAGGVIVGTSLGLAGGVSGLAAITLIPWVNALGDRLFAALH